MRSSFKEAPGRCRARHEAPFGSSGAISIQRGQPRDDPVPPPLPPPKFLPSADAPQLPDMRYNNRDREFPSSSLASGYGSMGSSMDHRPSSKRRDTNTDEGYASFASADKPREPDMGLHHSKFYLPSFPSFQPNTSPATDYTDKMKEKLNSARPSPPRSSLSSALAETAPRHIPSTVQLPYHNRQHREPVADLDRSPRERTGRNNSHDSTSAPVNYDYVGAEDMEMDDSHAATGQKRKASPQPKDAAPSAVSVSGDVVRRMDVATRGSPTPRLTVISPAPSASSGPLAGVSRPIPYMPPLSMLPAGITPANSYGRRSPGGVSPGGISPTSCSSPYATPTSLTHSPRSSISARVSAHGRAPAAMSPRKLGDEQKPANSKLQGFLMCECCPKKPKKFETMEELNAHEAEKQYECHFCGSRFKNKNEAERHQNSLHVRRHSWSCSALSGCERAFHDSTNRPGEADTCGYCGEDFPRSGRGPGDGPLTGFPPRHPTELDWDERIRHLQDVHKFGECNAAKKFYRADHFRQHLKHSHAGTSGKWTNMLENACMVEEDQSPR
ncbi:hypothetical protein XA68_17220 [Ophiocordyceps unilateralis]|uniref:C2H2-type domain-containing protein n=1 Tax=Ophiocordyceps unilateralis TaxID=268505 RepID=A0A2A9P3E4_OPHUN|nr:hypothetical protein XA68_17220 [Ophiocordyceps unilateralis]